MPWQMLSLQLLMLKRVPVRSGLLLRLACHLTAAECHLHGPVKIFLPFSNHAFEIFVLVPESQSRQAASVHCLLAI